MTAGATIRIYVQSVRESLSHLRAPDKAAWSAGASWRPASDVKVLWFLHTYRDRQRLESALARLFALYERPSVLVVADGDDDPLIPALCERHGAAFSLGARLYGVEHGGALVQRMLQSFLATDADVLIKIDPDSDVRHRFSRLPSGSEAAVYGTIETVMCDPPLTSVQGGCIIVPRSAAQLVVESGWLGSDRLKPPAAEWANEPVAWTRAARGLTSDQWTLGWACRMLDVPMRTHPEVFARYRPSIMDLVTSRRVAVAHPQFTPAQLGMSVFYFSGLRTMVRALLGRAPAHYLQSPFRR